MRKSKDDLIVLAFMSFLMFAVFFAQYLDSGEEQYGNDVSEFIFRALTHVRGDFILALCNTLVWGSVPFAIGIMLKKKRYGKWLVWGTLLMFATLKTLFKDFFFIHQYPQALFHTFEWNYVLVAWLIVYALAALFIINGVELMSTRDR
jgi:hypothetical protein